MQEIPNLDEVLESAKHNHGQRGDVIGINVGSKFQDGVRRANFSCVQFYVTEKKDLAEIKNPLRERRLFALIRPDTDLAAVHGA